MITSGAFLAPPFGPISFIFTQFFGKIFEIGALPFGIGAPWEILDQPLITIAIYLTMQWQILWEREMHAPSQSIFFSFSCSFWHKLC